MEEASLMWKENNTVQLLCYAKNFIDVEIIFRIAPLEADLLLWIPRETQAEGFLATSKRENLSTLP